MKKFYRNCFLFILFSAAPCCKAFALELNIHLSDSVKAIQKKKISKGVDKLMEAIGYLNYSDRRVDRNLSGIGVFEKYRGKTIRNITIKVMYPYGVDLDSPDVYHPTKFQKFKNKLQFKTHSWVIENELLFKSGDAVDPISLADSERNLWGKGIYKDVKFFISEVDDNTIDITVLIRDKWNWSVTSNLDYNQIRFGVQFNNVLGLPQVIGGHVALNYRADNLYTLYGYYKYNNIKSTQINIYLEGTYDKFLKGFDLSIYRPFFSAHAKWAGHANFSLYNQTSSAPTLLSNTIKTNIVYNSQDFWIARAFEIPGALGKHFPLVRIIASAKLQRTNYTSRPFRYNADYSQNYLDQTYIYGSVGFASWDYYVDRSVYKLTEAEYFTKGINAAVVLGFHEDELLYRRFYTGFRINYGVMIKKGGYFLTQFSYGGYTRANDYQQGLISWQNNFYTQLVKAGKCHIRNLLGTTIKAGFNTPLGKEIVVNASNGLRGLYTYSLRGQRSYTFNYEIDFLAYFKVLGFTSAVFIFTDMALIQQSAITQNKFQSAVGFGLRLRNLNMGIGYIQLTFAYYPNLNIPEQKPFYFNGTYFNDRALPKNDLFQP